MVLHGKKKTFKALGFTFSLDTELLLEQVMNCWRQRNLSLIGKIKVVKSLLLPQLLYLFSVLCINIPHAFFKRLDSILYKCIWNVLFHSFSHLGYSCIRLIVHCIGVDHGSRTKTNKYKDIFIEGACIITCVNS